MATFKNAINKYTYTEKGSLSMKTTSSACLDLFAQIGAMRTRSDADIISLFRKAFKENPEYALRILLYARDIRGGLGERHVYHVIMKDMIDSNAINLDVFADTTTELGYWKDIFEICSDKQIAYIVKRELSRRVAENEKRPNLMEKYMFSIGGKDNKRAETLAHSLGLTPRQYRKYLSKARAEIGVVETKMCANEWSEILYEHVPSKANLTYSSAFRKHDSERYSQYLNDVNSGKAKMNATTLYPYDIVRKILNNHWADPYCYSRVSPTKEQIEEADTLWKNIKDYPCDGNSIVVCDVSGSMFRDNNTPISISTSLAMYFAERNEGKFKGQMITFSSHPAFFEIEGDNVVEKLQNVVNAEWGGNTNLNAVFSLILNFCRRENVPQSEMPKRIIIVSDMQFDLAVKGYTNFEVMKAQYQNAGYQMPEVVFWNANARPGCIPVSMNEDGVALVSGASASIFENIASAKTLKPMQFMLDAIMKERYDNALDLIRNVAA